MGWLLGASVDEGCDSFNECLTDLRARQKKGGDSSFVQALFATSEGKDTITPMLATTGNWAKFAATASTILAATVTLCGADAVSHFKSIAQDMSKSLRELCDVAAVSKNLKHEAMFPQWVFDFVTDHISVAAIGQDLEKINDENLARWSRGLDHAKSKHLDRKQDVAHYFFVYHPATDWHAAFNKKRQESPLPGFVGCTNNLDLLGLFLVAFRKVIGPEAIIHILLLSAHMYIIEEDITIPAELQPIKFKGQIHRSGNPYVHAAISGLPKSDVQDVGHLIRPNKNGAWTKVGAAAGGIGGVVAGGIAGGCGLTLIGGVAFALAGPVVLPFAVAGVYAGILGGGSAAGAAAGMRITEDAKWKGTGRDSNDKHQKIK